MFKGGACETHLPDVPVRELQAPIKIAVEDVEGMTIVQGPKSATKIPATKIMFFRHVDLFGLDGAAK